jgi:hypothetical protein
MLTRDDVDLIASQLELLKGALQGQTHDPPADISTQSERELLAFLDAASNEAWMTDRIRDYREVLRGNVRQDESS